MAHALASGRTAGPDAPDGDTVAFYEREAARYAASTLESDLSDLYPELLDRLPAGGLVLDAGSGSGRDVREFLARGFRVEAFDASPSLAAFASERTGVAVEVASFEDWRAPTSRYDGVWCFASLLHVSRSDLPRVLRKLSRSLKPAGWMFASFKQGSADSVDEFGRRFTNMTPGAVRELFSARVGLETVRIWAEGGPVALGGRTTWVYLVARRAG